MPQSAKPLPEWVLIAMDDPVGLENLRGLLAEAGITVRLAPAPPEPHPPPDSPRPGLVFANLHPPEQAAGCPCRAWCADTRPEVLRAPVVAVSMALRSDRGIPDALSVGADDFLPLPADPDRLRGLLHALTHTVPRRLLKRDRNRFQAMLEQAGQEVYLLRPDGSLAYANPAAASSLGYPRDQLATMHLADIDPRYGTEFAPHLADLRRRGALTFETEHLTRDNRRVPKEITSVLLHLTGEEYVCGFGQDITARKVAEAVTRTSEQRLRRAQSMAGLADWHLDLVSGAFTASPEAIAMWGFSAGSTPSFDEVANRIVESDRPAARAALERALATGEPYQVEFRIRRLVDGAMRYIRSFGEVILKPAGQPVGVLGANQDVTAARLAEAAVRAGEERFRAYIEQTPDAHLIIDREHFIDCNRAALGMLGVTDRAAVVGKHPVDLSPATQPDGRPSPDKAAEMIQRALTQGSHRFEWLHQRADGHVFLAEVLLTVIQTADRQLLHTVWRDITAQREAAQALQESERRLRAIGDNLPGGMVYQLIEQPDGSQRFSHVSAGVETLHGHTRETVLQNPGLVFDQIHPEDRARLAEAEWHARQRLHNFEIECRIVRPDGQERWVRQISRPRRLEGGGLVIDGIELDITEQKQAAEERARLEEHFHQLLKMESIGQLAGGVAHDLNNLLTPIIGYGQLLQAAPELTAPNLEAAAQIVQAAGRARDLVTQLLAFSRKQVLNFRPVDLNGVVERFLTLLRRTIRENIAITFLPGRSLPAIQGDTGQLEQVIMNLAINAQDAMPDGGRLTLTTERVHRHPGDPAFPPDLPPGPYVRLSVSDTGRGMDAATLDRVFEPFFTTKELGQGTGLGLATVYGIVRQHGGQVQAVSTPGQGAAFTVTLPVAGTAPAPTPSPAPLPATPPSGFGGGETVLVVEDDEMVRMLAVRVLRRFGYRVIETTGSSECLAILERLTEPIHLLLTDVVMPGLNGRELYELIAPAHPGMRVIFMSGYAEDIISPRGVLDRPVEFIQKPFQVEDLAARVRRVLDGQGAG